MRRGGCVWIGKRKKEIRKFGYANPIAGWPSEVLPTLSVPDRVRYARASRHCKSYYDRVCVNSYSPVPRRKPPSAYAIYADPRTR